VIVEQPILLVRGPRGVAFPPPPHRVLKRQLTGVFGHVISSYHNVPERFPPVVAAVSPPENPSGGDALGVVQDGRVPAGRVQYPDNQKDEQLEKRAMVIFPGAKGGLPARCS
jgi:hypothetical protein